MKRQFGYLVLKTNGGANLIKTPISLDFHRDDEWFYSRLKLNVEPNKQYNLSVDLSLGTNSPGLEGILMFEFFLLIQSQVCMILLVFGGVYNW